MALEFDGAGGVNQLVAIPVIFEHNIVDDELIVEMHGHFVANHFDVEGIPFADRLVRFSWNRIRKRTTFDEPPDRRWPDFVREPGDANLGSHARTPRR